MDPYIPVVQRLFDYARNQFKDLKTYFFHNTIYDTLWEDPARIKKQYGANLCFWGTIDEQHTLPFGTPEDVKNEVITRLKTIGKSGGLIIGPTHHIQLDTPLENFQAMANTIVNTPYSSL